MAQTLRVVDPDTVRSHMREHHETAASDCTLCDVDRPLTRRVTAAQLLALAHEDETKLGETAEIARRLAADDAS